MPPSFRSLPASAPCSAPPSAPVSMPPIMDALQEIERAIHYTSVHITTLSEKISPVLAPPTPQEAEKCASTPTSHSPLESQLRVLTDRLAQLCCELKELTDRVEL